MQNNSAGVLKIQFRTLSLKFNNLYPFKSTTFEMNFDSEIIANWHAFLWSAANDLFIVKLTGFF